MTRRAHRSSWVVVAVAVLVLACLAWTALAGAQAPTTICPPPSTSTAPAAPTATTGAPGAEQVLACVGSQLITGTTFLHWAQIARNVGEPSTKNAPPSEAEVIKEVMGFLISSDWVIEQSRELGIVITEAQVRHNFEHIRNAQFPKPGEFAKFLKRSGQTVADLLLRVRLNLLSARIQKKVVAGHHSARAKQKALARFVSTFKTHWTALTYCEPTYAVADCGHTQSPL